MQADAALPYRSILTGGNAYERGFRLGSTEKSRISTYIDRWLKTLPCTEGAPLSYIDDLLAETDHLSAAETLCPDAVQEVRGMADGAGRPFSLMFAYQLMDEEWNFRLQYKKPLPDTDKCSVIGVAGRDGENTMLAQNMDIGAWSEGGQTLIIKETRPQYGSFLALSFPGYLGLCGVSANGFALTCNALVDLPYDHHGLPVAFVVRAVLEAASMDDAVDFLKAIPHASGQCYTLADKTRLISIEACATGVEVWPQERSRDGLCLHTNHPLWFPETAAPGDPASPTTFARLTALEKRFVSEPRIPLNATKTIERIKEALSSKDDPDQPVSREIGGQGDTDNLINYTFASMLFEMAARPNIFMTVGPPSQSDGYHQAARLTARNGICFND